LENGGEGIAIFESDHNLLLSNKVARNQNNGIYIRNSCAVVAKNNHLFRNSNNGAEVSVVDIDYQETRDFTLEPYHKSAQGLFLDNIFESNINSAVASKNGAGISIGINQFRDSAPLYFSGELESLTDQILNAADDQGFTLPPVGSCPL
jgi:parallel beta-helix repeat protein